MDYLPISMLSQLEYCERRFWLMHVQGEMAINAAVLEGTQQHQRAHTEGAERDGETIIHRRLYLWSDALKIAGFADLVEELEDTLKPVEYKRGKMGQWLNDHVQLCAQAMCLEERTGKTVARGEIFYWRSRRRVTVEFTPQLRARTKTAIQRAFELIARNKMPPPIDQRAKCRDCSLEEICLPKEVMMLENRK